MIKVMMMMGNNGEDNGDVNNKKKELDMSNRTQVKQKAKPSSSTPSEDETNGRWTH